MRAPSKLHGAARRRRRLSTLVSLSRAHAPPLPHKWSEQLVGLMVTELEVEREKKTGGVKNEIEEGVVVVSQSSSSYSPKKREGGGGTRPQRYVKEAGVRETRERERERGRERETWWWAKKAKASASKVVRGGECSRAQQPKEHAT